MRPVAALLVAVLASLVLAASAQAGPRVPEVSGTRDGGTATLVSLDGGGEGSGGDSPCSYVVVPAVELPGYVAVPPQGGTEDSGEVQYVVVTCPETPALAGVNAIYVLGDPPPVALLLQEARRRLVLPLATADMIPAPQFGVANAEAFLWIDDAVWAEHSVTASLPGASLTLTATPVEMTWDMGEGSDRKGNARLVRCPGPGVPYDLNRSPDEQSTYCSYTYNTTSGSQPNSEFLVRPYIEWARTWVCVPACGSGALSNLVMEGNTLPARVGEIQALGTGGGVG